MSSEVPVVTLAILSTVTPIAVEGVVRLLQDRRSCCLRLSVVSIRIINVDVDLISYMPAMGRILIVATRLSHHDEYLGSE
ncbi:MAG: hypothetical protein IIA75_06675 [Proteobacteria bacterium]|nr:hypothetical protein [Pseudomonadota bacterium]